MEKKVELKEAFIKCLCMETYVQSILSYLFKKLVLKHKDRISNTPSRALSDILVRNLKDLKKIANHCPVTANLYEGIGREKSPMRREVPIDDLKTKCILNIIKYIPGFLSNPNKQCKHVAHTDCCDDFKPGCRDGNPTSISCHPAWDCDHLCNGCNTRSKQYLVCCTRCQMCGKCNSVLTISKQCKVYRFISGLRVAQCLQLLSVDLTQEKLQEFLNGEIKLLGFPEVSDWNDLILLVTINVKIILNYIGDMEYQQTKEAELQSLISSDLDTLSKIYSKVFPKKEVIKNDQAKKIVPKENNNMSEHKLPKDDKKSPVTSIYSLIPEYYHGRIERENAERLLINKENGTYLLRQTYLDGIYYLSYKFRAEKYMHVRIENDGTNQYFFPNNTFKKTFNSLSSAVNKFMRDMGTKFSFLNVQPLKCSLIVEGQNKNSKGLTCTRSTKQQEQSQWFENCFWYFPKLSRNDAFGLLGPLHSGTYLLRDSSTPGSFALTFKAFDNTIRNLLIRLSNGRYEFVSRTKQKQNVSFPNPQFAAIYYMDIQRRHGFRPIPYGLKVYV